MSGRHGGQTDAGISANFGEGFQCHVSALQCPFVVLLEQQGAHQAVDGRLVGEDADDIGATLDFAVQTHQSERSTETRRTVRPPCAGEPGTRLASRFVPAGAQFGTTVGDTGGLLGHRSGLRPAELAQCALEPDMRPLDHVRVDRPHLLERE